MQTIKKSALSRFHSGTLLGAAVVLGMLYFGREILAPLAVAGIASLILLPLVRKLDALGLNRAAAALVSVLLVGSCMVALAALLPALAINGRASTANSKVWAEVFIFNTRL